MKITETTIPDISNSNIDKSKVNLANDIIKNVNPLFDDLLQEKLEELNNTENSLKNKSKEILERKKNIEKLFNEQKKKQKIKKLLDRIEKMVNIGIVNQGNMKTETVVLLRVVDNLDNDKINYHLRNTMNILTKRVGS